MDGNDQAREAARRRAVQARERTFSRGRKLLAAALGLSTALSGAFAALAASATHAKKTTLRPAAAVPAQTIDLPAPHAVPPSATPPGAAAPAPAPAPAAPPQPPAVTSAPPVATSGGT